MKLHAAPDYRDAIIAASKQLGLREVLIEKDYWVTYVLWLLSKSKHRSRVVFKGGTSLSKAYNIIRRFSEDIDLAVVTQDDAGNPLSGNQVRTLLKQVEQEIIAEPLQSDVEYSAVSKGSRFRKTAYSYPQELEGDFGQASNRILLEINSFANPYPFAEMEIESQVAEYLRGFDDTLVAQYELEPFSVNVLDVTRTFAEKIMGLTRASYQSDENFDQLREKIRHVYDVSKLLEQEEIQKLINETDDLFHLLSAVRTDDQKNHEFQGEWSKKRISGAHIFSDPTDVLKRLDVTFRGDFQSLLFSGEKIPNYEKLAKQLSELGKLLQKFDDAS